ncbi:PTC4 [Candida oxycetoniae]|uniref:protein-serine/threonine phosphatase n=1 Tax=Candida oxycetoniae TaxID=497107 RepID=A0AAI9SY64_9ASCO|nr:PTC4 [Candida oxycetoniae]KAI3405323.2 PTC4 [Candida oxycetoniae]
MGQLLSHPIEEKELDYKVYSQLSYCIGSMQGYRMSMEDAHDTKINEDESIAVFGVFDGHGGKQCSQYLAEHLIKYIFKQLVHERDRMLHNQKCFDNQQVMRLLKHAYFKIDHDLSNYSNFINCGSTGITLVIINNKLYVANTGDSRCIISIEGGLAKTLSHDQKPNIIGERVRVENSNGYIVNNRVNEILALSRAFGDFKFKVPYLTETNNRYFIQNIEQLVNESNQTKNDTAEKVTAGDHEYIQIPPESFQVTVEPDILIYDMNELNQPEFIIMACDGIWDCFKNGQLVKIIRDKLVLGWKLNKIVECILNDTLAMANNYTGTGFDNMTLVIIALHGGGSQVDNMDEWYQRMIDKIEKEKRLR